MTITDVYWRTFRAGQPRRLFVTLFEPAEGDTAYMAAGGRLIPLSRADMDRHHANFAANGYPTETHDDPDFTLFDLYARTARFTPGEPAGVSVRSPVGVIQVFDLPV